LLVALCSRGRGFTATQQPSLHGWAVVYAETIRRHHVKVHDDTCSGIDANGERCRRTTWWSERYCYFHAAIADGRIKDYYDDRPRRHHDDERGLLKIKSRALPVGLLPPLDEQAIAS
jgi:hypothetical protein